MIAKGSEQSGPKQLAVYLMRVGRYDTGDAAELLELKSLWAAARKPCDDGMAFKNTLEEATETCPRFPGLHLLPAAGGQRRPDRESRWFRILQSERAKKRGELAPGTNVSEFVASICRALILPTLVHAATPRRCICERRSSWSLDPTEAKLSQLDDPRCDTQ
jgi:hypothetical protein